MPKNVIVESLTFRDDSQYTGQVWGEEGDRAPHGYGRMRTSQGFEMIGYFLNGKNTGPGIFVAPNGDTFYGSWDEYHKRQGKFMAIFKDKSIAKLEVYKDGKLAKRIKPRRPAATKTHWWNPIYTKDLQRGKEDVLAVSGHTVCEVGGFLILFGGERKQDGTALMKATNDLYIYDKNSASWNKADCGGDVPPPMSGHTATRVGSRMIVIGGRDGIAQRDSVYSLDMSSGRWSRVVSQGVALADHTATLIGSKIWCISAGNVFSLDTGSWTWKQHEVDSKPLWRSRVPVAVINHSAVACGSMILVFGGLVTQKTLGGGAKNYQRCSNALLALDTVNLTWSAPETQGPETKAKRRKGDGYWGIPQPTWKSTRSEHTATMVGDEMVVIGGFTTCNPNLNVIDQSFLGDVQCLNVETLRWRTPPVVRSYSQPTGSHQAVVVGDQIWVVGGRNHSCETVPSFGVLNVGEDKVAAKRKSKAPSVAKPAAQPAAAQPVTRPAESKTLEATARRAAPEATIRKTELDATVKRTELDATVKRTELEATVRKTEAKESAGSASSVQKDEEEPAFQFPPRKPAGKRKGWGKPASFLLN